MFADLDCFYLYMYLKSQDYGEAQQGRLTM